MGKLTYRNTEKEIWFKSNKANGYAWLSNFWPDVSPAAKRAVAPELESARASFLVNGKEYKTVEHYFHSVKYVEDDAAAEDIRAQPTALEAKKRNTYYRHLKPINLNTWKNRRIIAMKEGLRAKFTQNVALRNALLSTEDKKLQEVPSRGGGFWEGGRGENKLGILLMELRDELKDDQPA